MLRFSYRFVIATVATASIFLILASFIFHLDDNSANFEKSFVPSKVLRGDIVASGNSIEHINGSESLSLMRQSKSFFLRAADMIDPIQEMGHYSGMWWMTKSCFMSQVNPSTFNNLEDASVHPFGAVGLDNIFMTRDWLNWNVEHLSRFVKMLDISKDDVFERLVDKLRHYSEDKSHAWPSETALSQALGIIPIFVDKSAWQDDSLEQAAMSLASLQASGVSVSARKDMLDMLYLIATLISLGRAGMKRILVVGNAFDEPTLIRGAFRFVREKIPGADLDLTYHCPFEESQASVENLPQVALAMLKVQLQHPGASEWLGASADRFKYIYFSEPDLILHTRFDALRLMIKELEQPRCSIWTAHRFHPLPHAIDFPSTRDALPMMANFSQFKDISASYEGACCDAGNYWPGRMFKPCGAPWYQCGEVAPDEEDVLVKHKRLSAYPMIRLQDGINTPLVDEHARMCIPTQGGCG